MVQQELEGLDQDRCRIVSSLFYGPMVIIIRQQCCKLVFSLSTFALHFLCFSSAQELDSHIFTCFACLILLNKCFLHA
jgi:hypothetical protein